MYACVISGIANYPAIVLINARYYLAVINMITFGTVYRDDRGKKDQLSFPKRGMTTSDHGDKKGLN